MSLIQHNFKSIQTTTKQTSIQQQNKHKHQKQTQNKHRKQTKSNKTNRNQINSN